ncbi:hypothetical protein [Escherichia sp. 93.0816]|uniref:hypothetical protein n=1 Tax=Escherichia sp. 93.0816 TaxID=2723308 RepID=UPI0015949B58|nr:hypothetical protein [Escherichia sp. 93.0816]MBB2330936.1 hypothetical protein [Escherichia sp. 93.0816]
MKKKAAKMISAAFATPVSLLDATLVRLIQPGLSFVGLIRRVKRRIRHETDYFLISYSGV